MKLLRLVTNYCRYNSTIIQENRHNLNDYLNNIHNSIINDFDNFDQPMKDASLYFLKIRGKYMRPSIVLHVSQLINHHRKAEYEINKAQFMIAKFSEMVHTATLLHDDVVDLSEMRRNIPTVNELFGNKNAILAGNLIMSLATDLLAQLNDANLVEILTTVILDLVSGELIQVSKCEQNLIDTYLEKTFKKTASLFAYTSKSAAYASGSSIFEQTCCYEYGKNIGIAFQLIDDYLDYSSFDIGKPKLFDLSQGIVTAPVLFAADQFPEIHAIIKRNFELPDDVNKIIDLTLNSDGPIKTRDLALKYADSAIEAIHRIPVTPFHETLITFSHSLVNRDK